MGFTYIMQILSFLPRNSDNYTLKSVSHSFITDKENRLLFSFKGGLNQDIFVKERILKPDEDLNTFLDKVIDVCCNKDEKLKEKALNYIKQKKIILSKSIYRTIFNKKTPIGTCCILVSPNLNPKSQIIQGNGLAINLSGEENAFDVLSQFDKQCMEYGQLSSRKPAGISIIDIFNSDIERFINYANDKDFKDVCYSTSIKIPESFFDMVDNDDFIKLNNGKYIGARHLYNNILTSISKNGNPGIIFDELDTCNSIPTHPFAGVSTCAEMGLENQEAAMFSYINLNEFINGNTLDYKGIYKATEVLSKLLDSIIDINVNENRYISNINGEKRRYGIGIIGYADVLAEMGLRYGSEEALQLLSYALETVNYATKNTSVSLAKQKGEFPLFNESRYNEFDYLVKHSDSNSPITENMWIKLYNNLRKFHIRNATTTALAPSCSSARIIGTSYSIEPYLSLKGNNTFYKKLEELNLSKEQKQQVIDEVNKTGSCQKIDFLPDKFKNIFRIATEINYIEHIDTVSTAQKYIDDGISKTVNLPAGSTIIDIDKTIRYAKNKNLKGITAYINNNTI